MPQVSSPTPLLNWRAPSGNLSVAATTTLGRRPRLPSGDTSALRPARDADAITVRHARSDTTVKPAGWRDGQLGSRPAQAVGSCRSWLRSFRISASG
jgi:hypothetical protein